MWSLTRQNMLTAANGLASLLSAGASVAAMIRPAVILPKGESASLGVRVYANAYGARQVPLAAATIVLLAAGDRAGLVPVLYIAGMAQAGDTAIGVQRGDMAMTISAGLCAALHLASARWFQHH